MKKISLSLFLGLAIASGASAQDFKMPAPSPQTTINQEFSTSKIEINYSRPSVKGRRIFGDLIPFGQEWRTGANGATKITFGEEVSFGGVKVPAGTYSLYTIPNKTSWEVILNTEIESWGLSGYDKSKNIANITIKPSTLSNKVETFTINLDNLTPKSADLRISWENTEIVVPISADNTIRIEKHLTAQLRSDNPPYLIAAKYYSEKGTNLKDALIYADKAIETNPKAFYIHWIRAEILQKLGQKQEALEAAAKAAEGAKDTPYEAEYNANYRKMKTGK